MCQKEFASSFDEAGFEGHFSVAKHAEKTESINVLQRLQLVLI